MSEEQTQQSEPNEPKRRRHSGHGHSKDHTHGRSRRRSSSSRPDRNNKITVGQILLLLWSVASLFTFLWMMENEQKASLALAIFLGVSTLVGLLLFFRTLRKKK